MIVYNGKYGWYTPCKNKDLGGNEIKTNLSIKFKRGLEPADKNTVGLNIVPLDFFFSCYQSKQGIVPSMIITEWKYAEARTENQKKESQQEPNVTENVSYNYQQPLVNDIPTLTPDDFLPFQ